MKRINILFLMMVISLMVCAQDYVPSPQTWDFMAQGRVPVNYYNGSLNYSLSIYEYKDKDFDIPISIYYNSAGFVPSKPAGIVGLNWALNVGGVITRKINGSPDEKMLGEINSDYSGNNGLWYGTNTWDVSCNNDSIFNFGRPGVFGCSSQTITYDYRIVDSLDTSHQYEAEPDEFEFNFMGHHGKFMLDLNGNPVVYNCDDGSSYKIDMSNFKPGIFINYSLPMDNSQIVITTNDGYKYYFGGAVSSKEFCCPATVIQPVNQPFMQLSNSFYTSWYLSKIIAPNGRIVEFEYLEHSDGTDYNPFYDFDIHDGGVEGTRDARIGSYQSTNENLKFWIATKTQMIAGKTQTQIKHFFKFLGPLTTIVPAGDYCEGYWQYLKTAYLTKILVDNYEIVNIVYSLKNQKDFPNETYSYMNLKVDTIVISNANSQTIRKATFTYGYGSDRMFLDEINISGEGNYSFTYNSRSILPPAETKNLDHWGFWTQQEGGSSIVPETIDNESTGNESIIKSKYISLYDSLEGNYYTTNVTGVREPHQYTSYSQAGMLTYISYPTGGGTRITYEPHIYRKMVDRRADNNFMPKLYSYSDTRLYYNSMLPGSTSAVTYTPYENLTLYAGGVRVKSIEDYDGRTFVNKREFTYKTDFNADDSGILLYFPRYKCFLQHKEGSAEYYTYMFNSCGISVNCFSEHICYSSVIESDYDGYTKYDFSNISIPSKTDDLTQNFLFYGEAYPLYLSLNLTREPNSHNYERGKLIKKTIFNSGKDTVQSTTHEYEAIDEDNFITLKKGSFTALYTYKNYLSACPLINTTVRNFSPTGSFINELAYSYGYNSIGLKNNEKLQSGTTVLDETAIKYPSEMSSGVYTQMDSLNMLNYPIVKTTLKGSSIVGSTLTTYKLEDGNYVVDSVLSLETTTPLASITAFTGTKATIDSHYGKAELKFIDYDSNGNILQFKAKSGIITSFLWDAAKTYKMARVVGATYSQISSQNGQASNYNSKTLWTSLNSLVPGAMVYTYSYKPLVGLVSETAPNGTTTYYLYDTVGRLSEVKNDDGKLLQKKTYNYANN
jgi:YD repeat-containing protein